jgi:hypothetical protein
MPELQLLNSLKKIGLNLCDPIRLCFLEDYKKEKQIYCSFLKLKTLLHQAGHVGLYL